MMTRHLGIVFFTFWIWTNLNQISTGQSNDAAVSIVFNKIKVDTDASLRGLSVVSDSVVWASGSKGTIIQTTDTGRTWSTNRISEAKDVEFRDIEGFDSKNALVLGAGAPAFVFATTNANRSWKMKYLNKDQRVFFDAFGFWDRKNGIAYSDPIDGKHMLIETRNGGESWTTLKTRPASLANEAGFAASGTCLTVQGGSNVWVGLGGAPKNSETKMARVVRSDNRGVSWESSETTIPRSASAGVFSLCFISDKIGFAVGGDYMVPDGNRKNFSITDDGGQTWRSPKKSFPTGFRSCVVAADIPNVGTVLVATGTNGTDISTDLGESWSRASTEGFHAIAFAPGSSSGWATGAKGKVARFHLKSKE